MSENNNNWTDKAKAAVIICAIPALIWLVWRQEKNKVDTDALAEQVASKVTVQNTTENFEKLRIIIQEELASLGIEEAAKVTDLAKFKKDLVTSAQFQQYVNQWCQEGVETINHQFDLCLKAKDTAESLAENRKEQNEKLKAEVNECIQSLNTVNTEYQKTDSKYQELLEKGKSILAFGPGGGYDAINKEWNFGFYVIYIIGEI